MIEEAAGTSMFEEKKEKAVKTMSRKEKRLDEIQEVSLSFPYSCISTDARQSTSSSEMRSLPSSTNCARRSASSLNSRRRPRSSNDSPSSSSHGIGLNLSLASPRESPSSRNPNAR